MYIALSSQSPWTPIDLMLCLIRLPVYYYHRHPVESNVGKTTADIDVVGMFNIQIVIALWKIVITANMASHWSQTRLERRKPKCILMPLNRKEHVASCNPDRLKARITLNGRQFSLKLRLSACAASGQTWKLIPKYNFYLFANHIASRRSVGWMTIVCDRCQ